MQDSNTGNMIFDTASRSRCLSSRITLQPGDLVLTGTPAGVGMGRKRFLQPGERVRLWIEPCAFADNVAFPYSYGLKILGRPRVLA